MVKVAAVAIASMLSLTGGNDPASPELKCRVFAKMVEAVATAHQKAVPASMVLENLDKIFPEKDYRQAIRGIVIMVYRERRRLSEEHQQSFITEWRDMAHVECLSSHLEG